MAAADLRMSFGALLIGCLIAVAFSGMASLQAYLYFRQYRRRDSARLLTTVFVVWVLDLLHTIFICQGNWHYLVLNWGNVDELDHMTWTVASSIAVTGFLTIIVQGFFANRLWLLSKRNAPLTIIICILATIRLGSALTTTSEMLVVGRFSAFIREFRWLFTLGLALSALIDVTITAALCFYLHGSRVGSSSIDDIIHRLLMYTVSNGVLTCLVSVLSMICAVAFRHTFLFLSLHFIIPKCYLNSLLATLNSRDSLKEQEEGFPMAVHISVCDTESQQPQFTRRRTIHSATYDQKQGHSKEQARYSEHEASSALKRGSVGKASLHDSDSKASLSSPDSERYSPSPIHLSPDNPYPSQVYINVERVVYADDGKTNIDS